ncbi:MAG: nitroreductase family protein [Firmicutes bacterium]|nr:nitroreductase family protein [Bacillota bacterium]
MNDFVNFALDRYSVRAYDETRPVEPEKIHRILQAAQIAPTAVNHQPQKIYLLQTPEAMATIRSLSRSVYNAPFVFLICADEEQTWHSPTEVGYTTGEMDASIVCTYMMLEAYSLGLGTCWVRLFDAVAVANAFQLPRNIRPVCLLALGYPADNSVPSPWHETNKAIEDFTEVF